MTVDAGHKFSLLRAGVLAAFLVATSVTIFKLKIEILTSLVTFCLPFLCYPVFYEVKN